MERDEGRLNKKERREQRQREKQLARHHQERRRYARRVLLWFSIIAGIAALIFGMVKLGSQPAGTGIPAARAPVAINELDWIKGDPGSNVKLIEYSDFQCPACAAYHPLVEELHREFGDRMVLAYRHFPLTQIHANSELAARAAEASGRQGKFWEMHDMIFKGQTNWAKEPSPEETFIGYARELGLDTEKFREDLASRSVKKAVEEDSQSGLQAGVNSTPTFFVNSEKIRNPKSYGEFRALIAQYMDDRP